MIIKDIEKYWDHLFFPANKVQCANKEMRFNELIKCFKSPASGGVLMSGPRMKHRLMTMWAIVTLTLVTMTWSSGGAIIRGAVCESTLSVLCSPVSRIYSDMRADNTNQNRAWLLLRLDEQRSKIVSQGAPVRERLHHHYLPLSC